nr:hypothetical protein [uncultured archaeon]
MCGKSTQLFRAEIESVEMQVCSSCAKFGQVKHGHSSFSSSRFPPKKIIRPIEPEVKLVSNFSQLLKTARDKRKMTQEEFAKFLQEKESMLAKWEIGEAQPNISTAEKIGRILGLNVILKEEFFAEKIDQKKNREEFTLGDFIKVRKRGGK